MMNKLSKPLHLMSFLCLLLPFFYTGCEQEILKERTEANQVFEDSTSFEDGIAATTTEQNTNDEVVNEGKEETPSRKLASKYPAIKPILEPKKDTFTGLALLIDSLMYLPFYSNFIFILLSVLALSVKYIDENALKSLVLIEFLALVFLLISEPISLSHETLYGYWVLVGLVLSFTLLDIFRLSENVIQSKKN